MREVAAASYTQEDFEDRIDRELARQDRDGLSDGESAASDEEDISELDLRGHEDLEGFIRHEVDAAAQHRIAEAVLEWNLERIPQQGTQAGLLRRMERQVETDGDSATTEEDQPEDAGTVEAHLRYQQEELKKENLYLRKTRDRLRADAETLAQEWKEANDRMDAMTREVRDLRGEIFQLSDTADKGSIGWNGPYDDTDGSDLKPGEVRNPAYEYAELWHARRLGEPEPPSWQEYWRTKAYVSAGRSNKDMESRNYEDKFRWVEGETRRMHPERADHAQVPWFQCVTHACKYHFKEKFDYNHWPVRTVLPDGTLKPVRWTFDQGQGAADFLWYTEQLKDGRLCIRPRQAWPTECESIHSRPATYCNSAECIWHLQPKAIEHLKRKQEQHANLTKSWGKRRNSDSSWERKSREWLKDAPSTTDDADKEDEGDAFHDLPREQVDYRRLNDVVHNPHQALGNGSGPSEGPEQL